MLEQKTPLSSVTSTRGPGAQQAIQSTELALQHVRHGRLWLALWIIGGIIVCAHTAPLTLILLPLASGIFIYLLARRVSTDTFLSWVVLVNFGLGIIVSTVLYGLACLHDPRIAAMVVKPGFWWFAGDAAFYHQIGTQIVVSFRHQIPFPGINIGYGGSYYLIVGLLYWLLGSHPMIIAIFNAMLMAVTVVLVFGIVETISHIGSARFAALVTALWPSMFLWSSQLLRDIPTVSLTAAVLYFGVQLIEARGEKQHPLSDVTGAVGLFLSCFLLSFLKGYVAIALMTATGVAVIVCGIRCLLMKREVVRSGVTLIVMAGAILSAYWARSGFLVMLINPHPKSVSSFSAGVRYEKAGRWDSALEAYQKAIVLQEDFAPAYLNMGLLLARHGRWLEGSRMLSRFLELYPTDPSAENIRNVVALLDRQAQAQLSVSKDGASGPASERRQQELGKTLVSFNWLTGRWLVPESPDALETPQVSHLPEQRMSPETIGRFRRGFITSGGHSLLSTEIPKETNILQLIKWTPAAVTAVLFSPYPWDWFDRNGHVLIYRLLAGLESLVVLILFPAICWGGVNLIKSRRPGGAVIVVFFFLLAVGIGITVVNAGTLFRLRLPVMIPLFIMAGVGVGSCPSFGIRFFADPHQTGTSD